VSPTTESTGFRRGDEACGHRLVRVGNIPKIPSTPKKFDLDRNFQALTIGYFSLNFR